MKIKSSFLLTFTILLVACSSSDGPVVHDESPTHTSKALAVESYSVEKQQYVQSCVETSDKSFCSCQFDVMDPILASSIGSNWSTKNMEEKDFETYVSAVELAVNECS